MKKFLFALALFAALPVAAADSNFGVKFGQFSVDTDTSAATQVGLVYTWDIAGMFGIEGEINTSLADGAFGPVDYGVTQAGAYGVLMTPGPFYFKAKAGYLYTDLDTPGYDAGAELGYGVGVGFELVGIVWEVEYTITDSDLGDADFISIGVKF
jgi:hypothetical protein